MTNLRLMYLAAHCFVHVSPYTVRNPLIIRYLPARCRNNVGVQFLHKMSCNDSMMNSERPTEMVGSETTDEQVLIQQPLYRKQHSLTICMVPPAKFKDEWAQITKARTQLKDPGLFRWPPHANIMYPFIDMLEPELYDDANIDKDEVIFKTLNTLQSVIEKFPPFKVSAASLGTFGGKGRGVLYLNPSSLREESSSNDCKEPLVALQSELEGAFPDCNDQRKHGKYTPHMTLSHFPSLESALEAKEQIEEWWTPIQFDVSEVYFLKREGDGGQFKIVATLKLGDAPQEGRVVEEPDINQESQSRFRNIIIHDPPLAFPDMPTEEEDWVHEERMKLKARRNGNGNRQRRSGRREKKRLDRGPSRSTDTPEEIARKRAERAAKRERRAREVAMIEKAIEFDE